MASSSEPDAAPGSPHRTARLVLDLASARRPTLGDTRLVSIDGPAGSGKSTLAATIAELDPEARVVHMDDLYDGWEGLASVSRQLSTLVRPLARGKPGFYRRYDWHRGEFAETVDVEPPALLVLEGVGSGRAELAGLITVLVWVAAPRPLRRERGLARDGEAFAPQWDGWMRQEDTHFAGQRTAERADVVVDGTGVHAPRQVRPRLSTAFSSFTAVRARAPSEAVDAHHRDRGGVVEVHGRPRRARGHPHRDDLRPLQPPFAVAVDHSSPSSSATTRIRASR